MFLAECFAIMPLTGLRDSNPRHVRFSYKSLPIIVTSFFMIFTGILFVAMLRHLLTIGISAKNFGKIC